MLTLANLRPMLQQLTIPTLTNGVQSRIIASSIILICTTISTKRAEYNLNNIDNKLLLVRIIFKPLIITTAHNIHNVFLGSQGYIYPDYHHRSRS